MFLIMYESLGKGKEAEETRIRKGEEPRVGQLLAEDVKDKE